MLGDVWESLWMLWMVGNHGMNGEAGLFMELQILKDAWDGGSG